MLPIHCTVLYSSVLYCTVLYCTVLYCTVRYRTVLYCTVVHCPAVSGRFLTGNGSTVGRLLEALTELHCAAKHKTTLHWTRVKTFWAALGKSGSQSSLAASSEELEARKEEEKRWIGSKG